MGLPSGMTVDQQRLIRGMEQCNHIEEETNYTTMEENLRERPRRRMMMYDVE
jgi:hypothetical protein